MTVKDFALERGYEDVKYERKWGQYAVYKPVLKDEHMKIGYPLRILENGDEIRMSTPEESLDYLKNFLR